MNASQLARLVAASLFSIIPVASMSPLVPALGAAGVAAGAVQDPNAARANVPASLVDKVRKATEPFQDIHAGHRAKYKDFLGCVSDPHDGAMGHHLVNDEYLGDGEIDINKPEALIYEPKGDDYTFVGVEYIVMADAWNAKHPQPPVLEGQAFRYNSSPNRYGWPAFYELHVWAWRDNPSGAYADWNPRVSCAGK